MGYGIAIPDPGKAVPYLQATGGRPLNRIAELKIFEFETVIDLGTPEKAGRLHQLETEAVGMRYIHILVDGVVPSQDQVNDFTQRNYSDEHPITVSPGANQRGEALLSPLPTL
ncbi:MAG: hypothetical protein KZQ60_19635, partial [Candidatus Thiodiazotropha sp. (ex Lucinoma aequizonata)]|nr:hypothetical protein [Candidatus Thiodiazotropha sp. (ex Lucinoma aequizonata)]MCU7888946.1 hypothetical protein [Candidatus Thiodiazotropha sp. (ex Lucinoma aequizonata)]MCU7898599.1 hypothetical protein [Candidatus Thiodiazotropha sp. (ex Lucinoma aequizonata)]MCU7908796.1 hypothetical protein [Candidatus Thiodiazotropha sp. (ex Lucinoma aequizonata)]